MRASHKSFGKIVEDIYNLPIQDKEELKNLLDHNISEAKRDEIQKNYKATLKEEEEGKLIFSSDIKKLKKML